MSLDDISRDQIPPTNKGLRFNLAEKYLSINDIGRGLNELLKIYSEDPNGMMKLPKKTIRTL